LEKKPKTRFDLSYITPGTAPTLERTVSTATPGTFPLSPFITSAARSVNEHVAMVCYW